MTGWLAWSVASRGVASLPEAHWWALTSGSRELARDDRGNVTLSCANGTIAKTFSAKGLLSSSAWDPYALRFARNAARLRGLGVVAPDVTSVGSLASQRKHVVLYRPVAGTSAEQALARQPERSLGLVTTIARFVGVLHALGVEFRSLHLANVIVDDVAGCGLVDVTDVSFHAGPLAVRRRARNLGSLLVRRERDRSAIEAHARAFVEAYYDTSRLGADARAELWERLPRSLVVASGLAGAP